MRVMVRRVLVMRIILMRVMVIVVLGDYGTLWDECELAAHSSFTVDFWFGKVAECEQGQIAHNKKM